MARRKTYRIAVAQLRVAEDDQRLNLCAILDALAVAADEEAQFLVAPEMALTGYHGRFDQKLRNAMAKRLRAACAECGVTLIVGAGDKRRGKTYNEQLIIGGDGRIIGRQAKRVPTSGDLTWCVAGKRSALLRDRGLVFGCMICNDLWVTPGTGALNDPRLTYRLARRGAKAIFHSVYSGSSKQHIPFHESNIALRAREGKLIIATANATAPHPVNCATGIMGPDAEWIIRCPRRGQQFAVADVDIAV